MTRSRKSRVAPPWERRDLWLAAGITLAALLLRLLYLQQWRHCPLFDFPVVDERYHDEWARAMAAGRSYVEGPYFRAPLYPWFLAAVYALLGTDYLTPRLVQAVLGALSCGLVYWIGRPLFGRKVAAVAGLAAASYWTLLYFDAQLLISPLVVFLDLVLLALLFHAARRKSLAWWGAAGAVLGLSAIARPNILLFAPAAAGWALLLDRPRWRRGALGAACFAAAALAPGAAVTARNWVVGGDPVFIASQGGFNFYLGNNPASDGRTALLPDGPTGFFGRDFAERTLGHSLEASEVSRFYYRRGFDFIRSEPARAFSLTILKARLMWSRWEIGNPENIYFWTDHFAPMVHYLPLRFAWIGPLGLLGIALCWSRRMQLFPLWGFALVYPASFVPFFASSRFRQPIVPVLLLLGSFAMFDTMEEARRGRWRAVAKRAVILVLAAVFVNVTPHQEPGERDYVSYATLGNVRQDRGELEEAVRSYRRALEIAPWDVQAACGLGETLTELGRLPEGIAIFRRVLGEPGSVRLGDTPEMVASLHSNLGNALAQTGNFEEALAHYRSAIEGNPRGGQGADQFNLGLVLEALGRPAEAVAAYRGALEVNSGMTPARQRLVALGETMAP